MCLTPVFIFHVHRFLCIYLFAWGFAHAPLCGLPQLQDLPGRLGDRQVADVRLALLKEGKDQQNEATERMEKGKVTLISFVLRGAFLKSQVCERISRCCSLQSFAGRWRRTFVLRACVWNMFPESFCNLLRTAVAQF